MRTLLQTLALSLGLLVTGSAVHAQVSVDVHIGAPPPPPRVIVVPRQPAPGYLWVEATGIRRASTTGGMTATGHGRRMKARTGSLRTTPMDDITPVAGKAIAATSTMTTTGTKTKRRTNITTTTRIRITTTAVAKSVTAV